MSQERTRFPIQPKDVRRSALSNKDVDVHERGKKGGKRPQSDKPIVPPHLRGKDDEAQD